MLRRLARLCAPSACLALLAACGGGGGGVALVPEPPAPPVTGMSVTQFLPSAADVRGGSQVTITGSGFEGTNPPVLVRFGNRVVQVTPSSDTVILVTVPPGDTVGSVPAGLISGSGLADLPGGFTYLAAPPTLPTMSFAPGVGVPGTLVDLTVATFAALASPSVTIGGVACTSVTVLDATRVRVQVPSGVTLGLPAAVVLSQGGASVTAQGFFVQGPIAAGGLVINEFLPDPGTGLDANRDGTASTAGDEFVEIVNRSTTDPVDLTGWTLSDAAGVRHQFPNPTTLPAGGALVVFGGGTPMFFAPAHASGHAQSATSGSLALNNTGSESIILRSPSGTLVAQVDYVQADVTTGRSRNATTDGGSQSTPSGSAAFSLHDLVTGAVGNVSPGVKVGGSGF